MRRAAIALLLLIVSCLALHLKPSVPGDHARAAARCAARGLNPPETPFRHDGCSLFPDGSWQECCIEHDEGYWCGGSYLDRVEADLALARCAGLPIMYAGVRLGGTALLPTPFRWGYGRSWPETR